MSRTPFTQHSLEQLKAAEAGRRYSVRDPRTPGLCLRVSDNGHKAWYWDRKVDGRHERVRLGAFGDLTLKQARSLADTHNGELASGSNPAERRRVIRSEVTLDELWRLYLARHARPNKRSWRNDERQYRKHLSSLGSRRLSTISRGDVARLHARISSRRKPAGGPVAANRVLALLSSMFTWAQQHCDQDLSNPCRRVRKSKETPRARYLSAAELRSFVAALREFDDIDARDAITVMLFTGQRKGNVLAMRWCDVDMRHATWVIPRDMAKTGVDMTVPLPALIIDLLNNREAGGGDGRVFGFGGSGIRRQWDRLLDTAGITTRLVPHDLRRTYASWASEASVGIEVIGALLGHAPQGVTASVYARVSLDSMKRAAEKTVRVMLAAADERRSNLLEFGGSSKGGR